MCAATPPNISTIQLREGEKLEHFLEFHQLLKLNKSQFKIVTRFLAQNDLEELQNWLKENFKKEYSTVRSMLEISIKEKKKREKKKK